MAGGAEWTAAYLESARAVGEVLVASAARARDGSVYWRGPAERQGQRVMLPLPATLFPGMLGVALLLAGLERVLGGGRYGALCREGLMPLEREVARIVSEPSRLQQVRQDIGGLSGLGSIVYGLTRVGDLLGEPSFHESARAVCRLVTPEHIASDTCLDVMMGCAGTLLALLALDERAPEPDADGMSPLQLARLCGERLLARREAFHGDLYAWGSGGTPMGGFCHGTAGIEYALLRLHARTGTVAFRDAAVAAMAHERLLFDAERGDWSYALGPPPRFLNSWCKGAPGLLLARAGALEVLDNSEVRDEIALAARNAGSECLSDVDDLCCGNLGRVDALLHAHSRLGAPILRDSARRLADRVLARAEARTGFTLSPKFEGCVDPRFFPGLSGIGYVLLRLAAPGQLPCVLAME
nr:lanthionine synthetase C family protein [Myxococcus fulvus]